MKQNLRLIRILVFMLSLSPYISIAQDQTKEINRAIESKIFKHSLGKEIRDFNPNWEKMEKQLSKKYDDTLVSKSILLAKKRFAFANIDAGWNLFADAWLEERERFSDVEKVKNGMALQINVNNVLYSVLLKNVNDKVILLRAAEIARKVLNNPIVIKDSPRAKAGNIDTYANLLYKAGKTAEAIEWQTKAVEYSENKDKEISRSLDRMKKGKPTW